MLLHFSNIVGPKCVHEMIIFRSLCQLADDVLCKHYSLASCYYNFVSADSHSKLFRRSTVWRSFNYGLETASEMIEFESRTSASVSSSIDSSDCLQVLNA